MWLRAEFIDAFGDFGAYALQVCFVFGRLGLSQLMGLACLTFIVVVAQVHIVLIEITYGILPLIMVIRRIKLLPNSRLFLVR